MRIEIVGRRAGFLIQRSSAHSEHQASRSVGRTLDPGHLEIVAFGAGAFSIDNRR
jgi:hypothetical protein